MSQRIFEVIHPFLVGAPQRYYKDSVLKVIPVGDIGLIECSIGLKAPGYMEISEQFSWLIHSHGKIELAQFLYT